MSFGEKLKTVRLSLNLSQLDTYFAMARGYQGKEGDVKALGMRKWFNTNYHYMVPEIGDEIEIRLAGTKPFDEFEEAKSLHIKTKPVVIGAFTLLKMSRYIGSRAIEDCTDALIRSYSQLLSKFNALVSEYIGEFDLPVNHLLYRLSRMAYTIRKKRKL